MVLVVGIIVLCISFRISFFFVILWGRSDRVKI